MSCTKQKSNHLYTNADACHLLDKYPSSPPPKKKEDILVHNSKNSNNELHILCICSNCLTQVKRIPGQTNHYIYSPKNTIKTKNLYSQPSITT